AAFFSHDCPGVSARASRAPASRTAPAAASRRDGAVGRDDIGGSFDRGWTWSRYTVYTSASRKKAMASRHGVATDESGALTGGGMPRPPQVARQRARRRAGASAGGKRMSRAAVVEAALRLVDRDGLDGVSMRRLAATLGATPMALYRHVPGKA